MPSRGNVRFLPDFECPCCQQMFRPRQHNQIYCSTKCKYADAKRVSARGRTVLSNGVLLNERRFWTNVAKTPGCWNWTGTLSKGYGIYRAMKRRPVLAHRVTYECARGPVPEGLELDHLCRNRACVNPEHLEAVTRQINVLRGISPAARHAVQTVCIRGHAFDDANTRKSGTRRTCRACGQNRIAEFKQRRLTKSAAIKIQGFHP